MPGVQFSVTVVGTEQLRRALRNMTPAQNESIQRNVLERLAFITFRDATQNRLKRGGKAPPKRHILTSRTGTGRRSVGVSKGGLPNSIRVGSNLKYMAVHETGGTFTIKRHKVRSHTRRVAFGRQVAPFQVPQFDRGPYSATYPKRPWLKPAVDRAAQLGPGILRREWEAAVRGG